MNPLKWQWNTVDIVFLPMFCVAAYENNFGLSAALWFIWIIGSTFLSLYGKNKWGWK